MRNRLRSFRSPSLCTPGFLLTLIILLIGVSISFAQDEPVVVDMTSAVPDSVLAERVPLPPTNIRVADRLNDAGGSIVITWDMSPDDRVEGKVQEYMVMRAEIVGGQPGEFVEVGDATPGATKYSDGNTKDGIEYLYKVVAVNNYLENNTVIWKELAESGLSDPIKSSAQWFNSSRLSPFIGILLLGFFIIYFINQAKSGKKLFIRKIAGMEAVDEAVGRATEMGKKIYYVPGLSDMDNVQTIAAMSILGRVAELAAEYETYLDVPVCRSMVMVTAREMVKEAYSKVGRPDSYSNEQVHYLTDDQFGYAAAIDGMVVREEPATIFYMGTFYAESLILAETGNSIGAIQIAGTAMPSQLPFFVAACDYTLIGEELFAASAYLSKAPKELGSLKGQDMGKAVILVALILGMLLETFNIWQFSKLFAVQ